MPPRPSTARTRYLPSRPISSAACGGARKSVSSGGWPLAFAPRLSVPLLELLTDCASPDGSGRTGSTSAGGPSDGWVRLRCGSGMGECTPASFTRISPAFGTVIGFPHEGHLAPSPANSSLTRSALSQCVHEKAIMPRFPGNNDWNGSSDGRQISFWRERGVRALTKRLI